MWIHMQRNITHEKEGNPSIRDSIDGSSGHAKWNESDRERQRLCDIISIKTEWNGDYHGLESGG